MSRVTISKWCSAEGWKEARAAKNWDLADAIRDQLKDLGLTIEDTAAGTRIKSL